MIASGVGGRYPNELRDLSFFVIAPPFFDNDLRFLLWVEDFAIKQLVPIPVP